MKRIFKKVVLAFFIIASVAVAALALLAILFEFSGGRRQAEDNFIIGRGQNVLQITNDLKAQGYIDSKIIFLARLAKTGKLRDLKAGEYDLKGLGQYAIIEKLYRAQAVPRIITLVPGQTTKDIASTAASIGIADSQNFMAVALDIRNDYDFLQDLPPGSNLEGYLFPDTYQMPNDPDSKKIIRLMLDNFGQKLTPEMRDQIKKQGQSVFDIIIMASMLEKEVKTIEDKKTVAGILYKRLETGMRLQVDSTLLYYAAGSPGHIDKDNGSRYNTYRYAGLPAGPICNPGIESIEAAIDPAPSDYLYYLSAKDGTTIFSRNYGEHLINKAKYLD